MVYGEAVSNHANDISRIDTGALTLGDLGLAIRQGRAIEATIEALARLAARNREEENDDERRQGSSSRRSQHVSLRTCLFEISTSIFQTLSEGHCQFTIPTGMTRRFTRIRSTVFKLLLSIAWET